MRKPIVNVRKRLLIVFNDEQLLRSITRALTQEGYDVLGVASAEEALRQVKRWRFDLWLVDLKLRQMDGLQFLEKSQPLLGKAGVVVLTGYGTLDEAIRAMELGARVF